MTETTFRRDATDPFRLRAGRLRGWLTGERGGLRHADLNASTERTALSDWLPWLLYDDKRQRYLTTNNSIGFAWECVPLSFAGLREIKALESLLRMRFPNGTVAQFLLYGDPNIDGFLSAFEANKARHSELSDINNRQFASFLRNGTEGLGACHGIPVRNFRLFVTLYSKSDLSDEIVSVFEELLSGAHLQPKRLPPSKLLAWMRAVLNGRLRSSQPGHWSDEVPLRKQVIDADTAIEFDTRDEGAPAKIGGVFGRCLTPKSQAKKVDSLKTNLLVGGIEGVAQDADQLITPFLWTTSVSFDDVAFGLNQKASLTMMQKGTGSFAAQIARRTEEFGWALDKMESDRFGRVMTTLWIFAEREDHLREGVSRAKRLWEASEFVMQEEATLAPALLIAALPFGLYIDRNNLERLERYYLPHAAATARFLPVQADFRGAGDPVLAYVGRKGQVIALDLFNKGSNNHNFLVAAESGSGKSFSLNYLCEKYHAANALIRIADIGYSYRKLASVCNGRFMDFGIEKPVINPFISSAVDEDDKRKDREMAANIVAEMAYSASGATLHETEWTLLRDAVHWTYEQGNNEAGIDSVADWLRAFPKYAQGPGEDIDYSFAIEKAHELAFNLRPFTRAGLYGAFFNGQSTFDIRSDECVVLELEQLKSQRELFTVVVMQVMNNITQDLYLSDRTRRRFILFEEAASFLKKNGVVDLSRLAAIIEEGFRRARKYSGSFGVVLQSILDLESFGPIGNVILENAAYKFLLEGKAYSQAVNAKVLDYEGLSVDLLTSVKNNPPRYSEMFIDTPFGHGVARLVVDAWTYWIATSQGEEVAQFNQLVSEGKTALEAIKLLSGADV